MRYYKFINRVDKIQLLTPAFFIVIATLIFNSDYEYFINKLLLGGIIMLPSLIIFSRIVKKIRETIDNIIIEDNLIKIYFWSSDAPPINLNKNEIAIKEEEKKIVLMNNKDSNVLGFAYKESIEDINKWEDLVNEFKKHT